MGGGITAIEASSRRWPAGDHSVGQTTAAGPKPVADAPETYFAFSTVGVGSKGFREFVIRDAGTAPLELARGATNCNCTVAD